MSPLLFLVHRIPYPPNKGDKVRSYHLLKSLSKQFDIYLGAFVDDKKDWQYQKKLEQFCKKVMLCPLNPNVAKLRSLKGLFTHEPLSLPYYRDNKMQKWVNNLIQKDTIKHALVFSSPMAQYLVGETVFQKRIADFVDIDSDKWRQYSEKLGLPMKWVYQREAITLLQYEKEIASSFDATFFVSREEKNDFDRYAPESMNKHGFYNNGVDIRYFDPSIEIPNPYEEGIDAITFTGAMDYWANVDAVKWYAEEIFSIVRKQHNQAKFYIVGSNPTDEVLALSNLAGVEVTGRVDDIRAYIRHARMIVAPMRIARGIQNKVLEAMAMAKPLVATSLALEGINCNKQYGLEPTDSPSRFAEQCLTILTSNNDNNGMEARRCIESHYDWERNLQTVINLLMDRSSS